MTQKSILCVLNTKLFAINIIKPIFYYNLFVTSFCLEYKIIAFYRFILLFLDPKSSILEIHTLESYLLDDEKSRLILFGWVG